MWHIERSPSNGRQAVSESDKLEQGVFWRGETSKISATSLPSARPVKTTAPTLTTATTPSVAGSVTLARGETWGRRSVGRGSGAPPPDTAPLLLMHCSTFSSLTRFFLISCIDINECQELDPCAEGEVSWDISLTQTWCLPVQVCVNNEGNYTCSTAEEGEVILSCNLMSRYVIWCALILCYMVCCDSMWRYVTLSDNIT